MANDEVLGPRKTMFVFVIVVGCFAVLWPRILSPLILGHSSDHLKPNKFDRDAGCCEVIFETDVAVLQLVNEVCGSAHSASECRIAVNQTCGVDIAAFLKRTENVGKNTKMIVEAMKKSNSSCLRQNFGVPVYSMGEHFAVDSNYQQDILKQERPPIRVGQHPALLERGRAIPPGPPPPARPVVLPPHVRVRSPLSVYYELDIKPPPIPGMRPPLGSPGGPVPAPKSSMGFVMPIYTICIIVFFVYTLSKLLFKRGGSPYEPVAPDPQFRRRVFRDDSRTSPDKLVVSAISGLVAEVTQQMEAGRAQTQQRQEGLDNARPYTNGTVLHSGVVQIVASEYKEKTPEPQKQKEPIPEIKEVIPEEAAPDADKVTKDENQELIEIEAAPRAKESTPEPEILSVETQKDATETELNNKIDDQLTNELVETENKENLKQPELVKLKQEEEEKHAELETSIPEQEELPNNQEGNLDHIQLSEGIESGKSDLTKSAESLNEERKEEVENKEMSTEDLLEEAIQDLPEEELLEEDKENQSVKVVGMELTAHAVDGGSCRPEPPKAPPQTKTHEAEEVQSIFLDTEIPQQSRVLVADFAEERPLQEKRTHSPLVVSGKITLSLIQDAPRDTPDRDLESTVDEFTTASAFTQPAEKEDDLEEGSDEEIEEEIEIEEIEEEVEEEEEEDEVEVKKDAQKEQ
ncbi:probable inactive protein kinase DDB_G0270444 isoform X3 [Pararge aegeria]|uniref:probable inactive protein kinase DDB_G0270444 isoform X3 n=1 Tax=Pararge aegeria TaxID=116150 RepID=UPI0019D0EB94|nr:probable inactive protein kinase DDB_G0270444 isoform X3 [Pararge aegeria]